MKNSDIFFPTWQKRERSNEALSSQTGINAAIKGVIAQISNTS
jgi:hypothetical protein